MPQRHENTFIMTVQLHKSGCAVMIITKQHQGMVTLTAYITTATVSDLAEKVIANISTTLNFAGTDLKTCPATLKYGTTALTAANTAQAVATDP